MAGLLVFIIIGGYAVFSILLIAVFVWNTPKRWYLRLLTGVITTLIATLPVTIMYWEYVQTKRSFERYCKKEAKVEIFKTVEQWKKENPGVAETLKPYTDKNRPKKRPDVKLSQDWEIGINEYLNPRFIWVVKEKGPNKDHIFIRTSEIIDNKRAEVMARMVDFSSGYGNPFLGTPYGLKSYKMWLVNNECVISNHNYNIFANYRNSIKNIGVE